MHELEVTRMNVMTYADTCEFANAKDWRGIDDLHLYSNIKGSHAIIIFKFILIVFQNLNNSCYCYFLLLTDVIIVMVSKPGNFALKCLCIV